MLTGQKILPAARNEREFEKALNTSGQYVVILNVHLAKLKSLIQLSKRAEKKVLLHADLVQGLAHDDSAAQFLCQNIRPDGLISTRRQILTTAKKNNLITVQRLFLLDSLALETSYKLLEDIKPDMVELLPGIVPSMIKEVAENKNVPVIAGGLIRSQEEVSAAWNAGASAISTTEKSLWPK
ncbi:glycerol-3-phosphate responsive antiterminator [Marinococcus halotolerans]|uniref:glycerol-3-phosphate responsive antiterminator n=1 Tax=Marinococcus halotolerans TaxID=301092 RepID=UPI0003B74E25|nr:glycerol-3-phosphate responsive antiterminator [Marinococcus halotolerans]